MNTVYSTPLRHADRLDRQFSAALARSTGSLSLAAMWLAYADWALHLMVSPGKQLDLMAQAAQHAQDWWPGAQGKEDSGRDRRFKAEQWHQWPYNALRQSFVQAEQWWQAATHGVRGVARHHEDLVAFGARQWLDLMSPGNYLLTNPEVVDRTLKEGGQNLVRGWQHAVDDTLRALQHQAPAGADAFVVGRDLATTPGKVVLRNRVLELIQYTPTHPKTLAEPVLIVPAWIMKYYILDLSPTNSMVRYLLEQGHSVFCISWKNPGKAEADLAMDDYLADGFFAALQAVNAICPGRKVHATGYCLGGTLLAIAAAAMARDHDDRLASMTLLAAQTDFTEPGELALFIDESQVSLLEAQMGEVGYLTAEQMAGAFQMLRSYDLLWSRIVHNYLMGDRAPVADLMAWNADTTRMPARMHAQYLRQLFLNDDLARGRYLVGGRPVALSDVSVPIFCVGTVTDHVAPWRSVYKLHLLTRADLTFVLTSGGHNAGIVSEPGHPHRQFQMLKRAPGDHYLSPDDWMQAAPSQEGSWWPAWQSWLAERSSGPVAAPRLGAASRGYPVLGEAPGTYVLEK